MTKYVLSESEPKPVAPDGSVFDVEIIKCEEKESPFEDKNGNKQMQVAFTFKVTEEGDFKDLYFFGNTPTTFSTHPDCKLRGWVEEILGGGELPVDFELDTEDLVNLNCRIRVGVKDGIGKDGRTPTQRNYIMDVLPSTDTDLEPF